MKTLRKIFFLIATKIGVPAKVTVLQAGKFPLTTQLRRDVFHTQIILLCIQVTPQNSTPLKYPDHVFIVENIPFILNIAGKFFLTFLSLYCL